MGFKELGKKKYRLFLILIVWLLIGYTFIHFDYEIPITGTDYAITGALIFLPLLVICIALFLVAAIFKGDLINPSKETFKKFVFLIIVIIGVFVVIGMYILVQAAYILFIISIFTYIFITAIFALQFCFDAGIKVDDKLKKKSNVLKKLLRGILFIGGTIGSILLLYYVIGIGGGTGNISDSIGSKPVSAMVDMLPWVIIYLIIGLAALAVGLLALTDKFNAWLGIYFLFIAIYASTLFIDAFASAGGENNLFSGTTGMIIIYCFDIFILLLTINGLIGKKSDAIDKKIKFLGRDAILIWLIFAKAAYEFAIAALGSTTIMGIEVSIIKSVYIFILFVPICVLMALNGMKNYKKSR